MYRIGKYLGIASRLAQPPQPELIEEIDRKPYGGPSLVKKPPCDRFAPVVGKALEGIGVPKPSSSLQFSPGGRDPRVRYVEHHHKIEREMRGRSFKYREATRESVFEQHHIRGPEIG